MKTDFKPFKIGTVFNPIKPERLSPRPVLKNISIKFPSRLNAMAIDPSKITSNKNLVYTPGEVIFSVKIYKHIYVERIKEKKEIIISDGSSRKPLIEHSALLMRKALKIDDGLYISVKNQKEARHCGLGSSSSLIAGVAAAINEIYGNPIDPIALSKYAAQNHGEEIDNKKGYLMPVQCIGGSAVGGLFEGGMKVLSGETCLIGTMNVPSGYKAVIGIPNDFKERDSEEMLQLEIKNFKKFLNTGLKFKDKIAYNILHLMLPAMTTGDMKTIGDVIFDYRFNMGSIKNCSFVYPKLVKLANKLIPLRDEGFADVLAISSVGPGIFAITKKPNVCEKQFRLNNMSVTTVPIENERYKIIKKNGISKGD
jgi:predicted sugar kinase